MNSISVGSPPDFFLFTEVVHCGEIGYHALRSFRAYHPHVPVHVFGLPADFRFLTDIPDLIFHDLGPEWHGNVGTVKQYADLVTNRLTQHIPNSWIIAGYRHGHLGTARLWAKVIKEQPSPYIIHFDSDVIFRGEVMSEMLEKIAQGYHLIGRYRNYRYNPNNRDDIRHQPDVCQTVFFAFDKRKISPCPSNILIAMCQGAYNPLGFPVIDFFDPVMFDILHNNGRVFFLDAAKYGGCNRLGKREKSYSKINKIIDFGSHLAHFSSVGSGMNFAKNAQKIVDVPDTYLRYALEKYAVYMKIFYNKDSDIPIDRKQYKPLFTVDRWY